jgi:hypothetical protein
MASICNDEPAGSDVQGGHGRKTHSLSGGSTATARRAALVGTLA